MTVTTAQYVKVAMEDRVAVVTIDHPPVNALNRQTLQELGHAIEGLKGDATTKAIVITGGGSFAFVAGADIKEVSQIGSVQEAKEMATLGHTVFSAIQRLRKPVIAAINGVCLGGGCELAMACHLRISGDRARFGQPEITLGIIPGWGGTQRLPRMIGKAKAIEWILTGDLYTAQEAARLGLVNQVVPQDQVLKAARELAKKIASKGAVAVSNALAAIEEGGDVPLPQGLEKEAAVFGEVAATQDSREGIKAFLEKRQPHFTDQ